MAKELSEQEWHDQIWKKMNWHSSEFIAIQLDWEKNRGKIPFSKYVPVVEYVLRTKGFNLGEVSKIKSEGKTLSIAFKSPNFENTYVIKFMPDRIRACTLSYAAIGDQAYFEQYERDFAKNCKKYGFNPSDYNREFELNGMQYRIVGLKSRKQTFGVVAIRLSDNKPVSIRTNAVIDALGKEIK